MPAKKTATKRKVSTPPSKKPAAKTALARGEAAGFWKPHVDAQKVSGLKPSEYCKKHNLNPKYFSRWKLKFDEAKDTSNAPAQPAPTTTTKIATSKVKRSSPQTALGGDAVVIKATLANGVPVELIAHSAKAVAQVLEQLSKS